jgi:hypothetical protein
MGRSVTVGGRIRISPPLDTKEIREHPQLCEESTLNNFREAWVEVTEFREETEAGDLVTKSGAYIVSGDDSFSHWELTPEVQEIVDSFPGHSWGGYLECFNSDDGGETWRLYVREGRVKEIRPKIVWPDDEEVE